MTNVFRKWMELATAAEKKRLARLANTSVGALHQASKGYRTNGKVSLRPEVARRIEIAASRMAREGLPELKREELCAACGRCEYARLAK